MPAAPPTTGWRPLVACCLGTFLLMLYTSVLIVALPAIGADLDAGPAALQWVVNAYTVALAGLLLGAGSIGDAFGTRRVYVIGVAGFTGATLLAGLAPDAGWLVAGRTAQGVAGALMFGCIPALIGRVYAEPRRRALAFAIWGAVAGASSAVGTVAGGLLTELLGWRGLFFAALPFCALALVLVGGLRLPPHDAGRAARVDVRGLGLATVAVTALAYAIARIGTTTTMRDPQVLGALGLTAVAVAAFVVVERDHPHPVLPPAILRSRRFGGVLVAAFAYYFAAFGALPALATWLQVDAGLGSFAVSLLLVVQLAAFIAASALLSPRLGAVAPSLTLGATTVAIGLAAAAGALVGLGAGWPALLPFLVGSGLAAGVISPALPVLTLETAPRQHAGAATSAVNAVRQLGLAIGVAVCSSLAARPDAGSAGRALGACAAVGIGAGVGVVILLGGRLRGAPGGSRTHTRTAFKAASSTGWDTGAGRARPGSRAHK